MSAAGNGPGDGEPPLHGFELFDGLLRRVRELRRLKLEREEESEQARRHEELAPEGSQENTHGGEAIRLQLGRLSMVILPQ